MIRAAILALAILASPAAAQVVSSPAPSTSTLATKAEVQAVQAAMPIPATSAPPPDTINGTAGSSANIYALSTHTHPRITYSVVPLTNASGVFSGTFPAGMFAAAPTIALTWESAVNISCQMNASGVTATSFSGRCNLLAGLLPVGAGIPVHVVALPRN